MSTEPSTIQAVIFDWGGVISRGGTPDAMLKFGRGLQEVSSVSPKAIRKATDKFKRGQLSVDEYFSMVGATEAIQQEVIPHWSNWQIFQPEDEILALHQQLRDAGLKIAILSNTFPPTAQVIRENGGYDGYDVALASSEVGFAKPDAEFFQMMLDGLGLLGESCLFIDDQEYCLVAASKFGIRTILGKSTDQIVRDVSAMVCL